MFWMRNKNNDFQLDILIWQSAFPQFLALFLIPNGPTHEILVLVAYAQNLPLKAHANIFGKPRGLNFGCFFYQEPYFECVQAAKAQASLCLSLHCSTMQLGPKSHVPVQKYPFDERICCL